MLKISVSKESDVKKIFKVIVTNETGRQHSYRVLVSPKTIDRFDLEDEELEDVVEKAFLFLLKRESPEDILPNFELMTIATYFPEFTPGIDM